MSSSRRGTSSRSGRSSAQGRPPHDGLRRGAGVRRRTRTSARRSSIRGCTTSTTRCGRWVDDGTPLFAVCLGAQTLAHALGGSVTRIAPTQLAGFYATELTADGVADPVLGVLPRRFEALNANALRVHRSCRAPSPWRRGRCVQAFRAGDRAWAVQFHPEVRRDQVLGWFAEDERDLTRAARRARAGVRREARSLARARCPALSRVPLVRRPSGVAARRYRSTGNSSWRDHSCHEPV